MRAAAKALAEASNLGPNRGVGLVPRAVAENTSRRPTVLPLLVNEDKVHHDQELWVTQQVLRMEDRNRWDPDSLIFRVRVHAPGGAQPKLAPRANEQDPEEILVPSAIPYRVYTAVVPGWSKEFSSPVATSLSLAPGGKTLEELALESGLWDSTDSHE